MKPSSSPSEPGGLFDPLFTTAAVAAAVGDRALVQAMLDAESALAAAQAQVGLVPAAAARDIADHCAVEHFDLAELAEGSVTAGNPVVPLVRALTALVPAPADRYVHLGATSQDILDTALVLVIRRALEPITADLAAVAAQCAGLAERHRDDVMAGRTLLQQAVPTTFGLKAAGWLVGIDEARTRLAQVRDTRLAAQFGGAAGTLASLGDKGIEVADAFATQLDLAAAVVPWHTLRGRLGELAGALGVVAGALGKAANDLVLLAQTEVGEVAGPAGGGVSSTMPHKRNLVGAVTALANTRRVPGLVATVLSSMVQEHERAVGAWHAEWEPLRELLRLVGGAAGQLRDLLGGLHVDTARMRANLDLTGGLLMAENVTTRLAASLGRLPAHDLVRRLVQRATEQRRPLREVLLDDPQVRDTLGAAGVDAALDPTGYLGSATRFVDRALDDHRRLGEVS